MATEDITMTSPPPPPAPPSSSHTSIPSHPAQQPPPSIPPPDNPAHPPHFDLGNLLITDPSPLRGFPPSDSDLHIRAQSCAQSLIAQLLSTCPIHAASSTSDKTLLMTLPPPTTALPREKPLPRVKEKTRWERFAEKKGIANKGDRGGNKVYDEAKGEWVPKYGYKGRNKGEEGGEWIVEVDEGKERGLKEGETVRGEGRRERKEKARRRERKERANERTGRKGVGGGG